MFRNQTKQLNRLMIRRKTILNFLRNISVTKNDIQIFTKILGNNSVKTEDLDLFNTDWLRTHKGLYIQSFDHLID
jgi:hypothetical protein